MIRSLEGKIALVMGGGRGIGAATASMLAKEGACVAIGDIRAADARNLAERIVASGGKALGLEVDVSREADVAAAVDATVTKFGRIDILHNNAAPTDLLPLDGGIADMELEVWDATFAGITRGTFLACKHVIPIMQRHGGGAIVNTSSMAGQRGTWIFQAYGAAKAAVDNLTRSIATRYGKDGIRCNAIAPGLIVRPEALAELDEPFRQQWLDVILGQRIGVDDDIARAVLFFVQDAADYITGQILAVDGGVLAWGPWGRVRSGGAPAAAKEI